MHASPPLIDFQKRTQKGNALFLILIAVALFAALAYAVTQSSRGGGSANREQQELAVSQLLQHFSEVAAATQKLILFGGCTDTTVRFWHASRVNAGNSNHYGDGSNPACQIFDPAGGGVAYMTRPAALSTAESDEIMVVATPIGGLGASNAYRAGGELLIEANVPRSACLAINTRAGVTNTGGEPPARNFAPLDGGQSPGDAYITFPNNLTGEYPDGGLDLGLWDTYEVARQPLACLSFVNSSGDTYYTVYQAIIER